MNVHRHSELETKKMNQKLVRTNHRIGRMGEGETGVYCCHGSVHTGLLGAELLKEHLLELCICLAAEIRYHS